MINKILLLLLCPISISLEAKMLIMTHCYNRPDFIENQVRTFKAFLEDDYEYVVFNDSPNSDMAKQINDMCIKQEVRCFRVPQEIHKEQTAWARHNDCLKYSFEVLGYDHDGIVTILDNDIFLIKPFSIEKYLGDYYVASKIACYCKGNARVRFLCPNLIFINMKTLPNKKTFSFNGPQTIQGIHSCDVGAQSYYYLKDNPSVQPKCFTCFRPYIIRKFVNCGTCVHMTCDRCVQQLMDNDCDDNIIKFIQSMPDEHVDFMLDNHFVHHIHGTNHVRASSEYIVAKTKAFNDFINVIINSHVGQQ